MSLSPRLKNVMQLVVQDYIRTAEPVGSEGLVARHKLSLSSATIRKAMAELEDLGLLAHPHTSAGRTPTEEGLRIYVHDILEVGRLSNEMRRLIDHQLAGHEPSADSVLNLCSKVLSNITNHMGVVIAPSLELLTIKQLYFVRLGIKETLAVVVSENGLMRNKVLSTADDYTQDELNQVNAYLAEICGQLTIDELKTEILKIMDEDKRAFGVIYVRALELSSKALADDRGVAETPIYIDGRENLLEQPEFAEIEALKTLFKAFEDKRKIFNLLQEVAESGRVRIVIGPEAIGAALEGLALVASPYTSRDRTVGALGIIGPQRLNYSKIVPVVNYAAQVVSELLETEMA